MNWVCSCNVTRRVLGFGVVPPFGTLSGVAVQNLFDLHLLSKITSIQQPYNIRCSERENMVGVAINRKGKILERGNRFYVLVSFASLGKHSMLDQ